MHYRDIITEDAEAPSNTFAMWHGSRRWDGLPEIRAPRAGRYEAGPGIYLTTNYETARKYAKGGGSTMLVAVDRDLHLSSEVDIPLDDAIAFVQATPRMPKKPAMIADLRDHARRMNRDAIKANILINLTVNHEAGAGNVGLALAKFLRGHGVDAGLEAQSGNEQWLVVINPKIIRNVITMPANKVSLAMRHLPPIMRA